MPATMVNTATRKRIRKYGVRDSRKLTLLSTKIKRTRVLKLLRMETQKEESSAGAVADENSEFYNTGRVGRRNALPDILSEHCRTSTAELPERLDAISISDNPSPEAGPSGASTSTASCTATTSNTTNEKT